MLCRPDDPAPPAPKGRPPAPGTSALIAEIDAELEDLETWLADWRAGSGHLAVREAPGLDDAPAPPVLDDAVAPLARDAAGLGRLARRLSGADRLPEDYPALLALLADRLSAADGLPGLLAVGALMRPATAPGLPVEAHEVDFERYRRAAARDPVLGTLLRLAAGTLLTGSSGSGRAGRSALPSPPLALLLGADAAGYRRWAAAALPARLWPDWWLDTAAQAIEREIQHIERLDDVARRWHALAASRRSTSRLGAALEDLWTAPVVTARRLAARHGLSSAGAHHLLDEIDRASVLREVTGRRYFRVFVARELVG